MVTEAWAAAVARAATQHRPPAVRQLDTSLRRELDGKAWRDCQHSIALLECWPPKKLRAETLEQLTAHLCVGLRVL